MLSTEQRRAVLRLSRMRDAGHADGCACHECRGARQLLLGRLDYADTLVDRLRAQRARRTGVDKHGCAI